MISHNEGALDPCMCLQVKLQLPKAPPCHQEVLIMQVSCDMSSRIMHLVYKACCADVYIRCSQLVTCCTCVYTVDWTVTYALLYQRALLHARGISLSDWCVTRQSVSQLHDSSYWPCPVVQSTIVAAVHYSCPSSGRLLLSCTIHLCAHVVLLEVTLHCGWVILGKGCGDST